MIEAFRGKKPRIHKTAFVHSSAVVIGDVTIGEHSSVWPGAVIRADFGNIRIGRYSCIQDNAVIHAGDIYLQKKAKYFPAKIGDYVIIGHQALVHGCTIEDGCIIGGGSVVFNGARVKKGSVVGLGAVVLHRTDVPPRTVVVGIPARPLRSMVNEEIKKIRVQAKNYAKLAKEYRKGKSAVSSRS